jgi:hypothetical protein
VTRARHDFARNGTALGGSAAIRCGREHHRTVAHPHLERHPLMFPELTPVKIMFDGLRARLSALREDTEAGYSAEAIVVIAGLVILALAVVAVVTIKVKDAANNINTNPTNN